MGYRLSKIVTRTGDDGTTQLEPGKRISKDHLRIQALGDIDELNSMLGLVLAYSIQDHDLYLVLQQIQQDLFDLGGQLCPPFYQAITEESTFLIEAHINKWNDTLPPLTEFILPGGNISSAHCHLARTICRRAERNLVSLHIREPLHPEILRYINRLSDLLFVVARVLARQTANIEVQWNNIKKI